MDKIPDTVATGQRGLKQIVAESRGQFYYKAKFSNSQIMYFNEELGKWAL